jgi:DNA-binding HxlR family transcriptional regulator
MFGDRRHFRRLLTESEEGIASNILAGLLRSLVQTGLLTRDEARRGQRATYSLTEPAIELVPVIAQLAAWDLRHRGTTYDLRVRAEVLDAGGRELWADFMDELRERHLGIPGPTPAGPRPPTSSTPPTRRPYPRHHDPADAGDAGQPLPVTGSLPRHAGRPSRRAVGSS